MKQIVVYLIAIAVIVGIVGAFATPQHPLETAAPMVLQNAQAASLENNLQVTAGILFTGEEDFDTLYFKNAVMDTLGEGFSVYAVHETGSLRSQKAMFQKMLDEGAQILFVELTDPEAAEEYITMALEYDRCVIFFGSQPSPDQLQRGEKLYYVGHSNLDPTTVLAQEIVSMWENDPEALDSNGDEKLIYAASTEYGFENEGMAAVFNNYLASQGVTVEFAYDSMLTQENYRIQKEVDRVYVRYCEMIIFTSSSEALKAFNYLDDPTEFDPHPDIDIVLLRMDATTKEMIENGAAMLAVGRDYSELGMVAANLARLVAQGETPTQSNLGQEVVNDHFVFVPIQILRGTPILRQAEE